MRIRYLALAAAPLALSACATVPVGDQRAISTAVEARLGVAAPWARSQAEAAEVAARVDGLLAQPLDQTSAMQVALATNPRVAAAFEGLGIGYANYVDAILPRNPVVSALSLSPEGVGSDVLKYGVGVDLLRLITWPAHATAGAAGRDAARAQATAEVLSVAANARLAFVDYVAARQQADLMAQAKQAADAAAVAADAIFAAGNSAQVDRDRERLFAAEVDLANRQAQAVLTPARERLIAALGLTADQATRLETISRLQAPPEAALTFDDVEAEVIAASTDVAIAAGAVRAAQARSSVSWITSLLPGLGLDAERERDGEWKEGLGVNLRLPIFGLGGADRLRTASEERRLAALRDALDREIRSEARTLVAQAESARQIAVQHRDVLLPLSADVFEGVRLDFNAMQIGVFQLLDAKRARLESGRRAVMAVRDYWAAQARLDILRAGGRATAPASIAAPPSPTAPADPGH
jgi:outer membrane protein, heavy metal efflux system